VKEIIVFDVCLVSSGKEFRYHFCTVAYLFEKMIKYAEFEVLRAIDLNKLICKYKKAIGKIENKALTTVEIIEK
jgi:hypothetical protein